MATIDYENKYKALVESVKTLKEANPSDESIQNWVKDNVPELIESEDERIRKDLIIYLRSILANKKYGDKFIESWIAWLEKQGEKTEPIEDFDTEFERQISHLVASIINKEYSYTKAFVKWTSGTLLNYAKHEIEKQGEQKSAWSQKDERIYQSIMDDTVQENQLNDKQTNWLKDIKYRYIPQPKQEWNEEDEAVINKAESWLDTLCDYLKDSSSECISDVKDVINKLKSLRPHEQWKPTEEQMEAIKDAIEFLGCTKKVREDLKSLYEQMKKLREE